MAVRARSEVAATEESVQSHSGQVPVRVEFIVSVTKTSDLDALDILRAEGLSDRISRVGRKNKFVIATLEDDTVGLLREKYADSVILTPVTFGSLLNDKC